MIIKLHSTYTGREILTYDADVIPRIGEHIVISRSPNAENELLPGSGGTTVCEVANVGHWVEESTTMSGGTKLRCFQLERPA